MPIEDLGYWLDDALLYEVGGKTPYQARLDVSSNVIDLRVSTDLTGVASDFSYPLNKKATEKWPLDLQMQFNDADTQLAMQLNHPI